MPLPSGSRMSTIAMSGSLTATRSSAAATFPATPTTSCPLWDSMTSRPSRRASWSSTIISLGMWSATYLARKRNAAKSAPKVCWAPPGGAGRSLRLTGDGQGHGKAHPAAVADLLPDGRAPARHGPGDPPRCRGIQRHERGRVRSPLLRRPRRTRVLGHAGLGRPARRRLRRAGELLAAARELSPPGDRVLRLRARRAADGALAARRRVRLRRTTASRPPADLLGPAQSAQRARAAGRGARDHRLGRRPRALGPPGQGRDGDLPQQDDHLRLLHDGTRRGGGAKGRPLPPALPGRSVLPPWPLPRARRAARLPPLAHARQ